MRHGVGIVDHIEDRIVGLKVRDIYEVPAAAIVLTAHEELEDEWHGRWERWRNTYPDSAEDWDRAYSGELLPGWAEALPEFDPAEKEKLSTRAAGATVMGAFQPYAPTMLGGAADLVESTKTNFDGAGLFALDFAGRNIPFGVREHAMGAIVNGLAVHAGIVKPYGSTFLIFSDYMRPAVRLAAMSEAHCVFAWTHDSVGLGEDGPTHQPVEHYMALRAIPNFWFVRPADANETSYAWRVALERQDLAGPQEAHPQLVAQHVVRAHRRAERRWDLPAVVVAARPVERAAAEHVPRPGVGPLHGVAVRVVVVVADAEQLRRTLAAQLARISTDDQFEFGIRTFLEGLNAQAS